MPNEIRIFYRGVGTPYAMIRRAGDALVWNGTTWVAWSAVNWNLYVRALLHQGGDLWARDFPADIPVGTRVQLNYYLQTGVAPLASDVLLQQDLGYLWTGLALSTSGEFGQLPVMLSEFRAHARIDSTVEDSLLQRYLLAAMDDARNFIGMVLLPQQIMEQFAVTGLHRLRWSPVRSVLSIMDSSGQRLTDTQFSLPFPTTLHQYVLINGGTPPFMVNYLAGVESVSEIPHAIILGIMVRALTYYERRDDSLARYEISGLDTAERLWFPYSVQRV